MKKINNTIIIGIDHGYGNIKTANCCFPTGLMKSNTEPTFATDLLIWNSTYYSIGVGHKEFTADKFKDDDYYVLTLAAIARELRRENITTADVHIAAGLPLPWVSQQKTDFKQYLLRNETADFVFRGVDYHIRFVGADIFPQGFAAVANRLHEFPGVTMLCDIGNGTMNLLRIADKKPDARNMYTEKYGTHQCTLAIRENMMKEHHASLDESIIREVLKTGSADIDAEYLKTVTDTAGQYTAGIFRRLREREYDPKLMRLFVVGGGGCLIKNFADYDKSRVTICDDICATAKGYEYMAETTLKRGRR